MSCTEDCATRFEDFSSTISCRSRSHSEHSMVLVLVQFRSNNFYFFAKLFCHGIMKFLEKREKRRGGDFCERVSHFKIKARQDSTSISRGRGTFFLQLCSGPSRGWSRPYPKILSLNLFCFHAWPLLGSFLCYMCSLSESSVPKRESIFT